MRNVNNWNGKWDSDKLVNKLPFKDLSTGLYRKNKVWSEKAQILGAPYPEAFFQRYEEGLYLKDRKVRRFSFTALHKYLWQKEWDAKYAIWWRINNLPAHLQRPPFPLPRNVEKQLKKTQGLQFILQKRLRQTKDWHRIVTTKLKQLKRRG